MKIRGAFVASRAILSKADNSLSLIELTDVLTFVGLPDDPPDDASVFAQVTFVALHEATSVEEMNAGPIPAKFWIETPKGRKAENDVALDFVGTPRSRVLVQLPTLPYAGLGTYAFCLESPAGVAKWEVDIVAAPPPDPKADGTKLEMVTL